MKKTFKGIICAALCAVLLMPSNTFAYTLDELKAKQEAIRDQQQAVQNHINSLDKGITEAKEYQALLEQKIDLLQENISVSNKKILELNAEILELTADIEEAAVEYQDTIELLKERIKVIYTAGTASTLEILLNSKSLYDFSLRTTALETVTEHDQELINKLQDYAEETKDARATVLADKEEVAELRKQLELDIEELNLSIEENVELLEKMNSDMNDAQAKKNALSSEDKEYNDLIQQMLEDQKEQGNSSDDNSSDNSSSGSSSSGSLGGSSSGSSGGSVDGDGATGDGSSMTDGFNPIWPVPGYGTSYITCRFGPANGYIHYGLDIGAPAWTPIVATVPGKVVSAQYHYSWGNNVFIYHNGTFSTRYAHMVEMAVSPGEYVEAGDIIGYVGNTGNSFGNHLHFEVYKNGTRVNPEPYLT